MNYGIPYMGSKSKICEKICSLFPRAENFYDLFGGGFSVTHFMLKHRRSHYGKFHFNEIRPGVCQLIKNAIAGKFNYEVYRPEWIGRERFFQEKEIDPMIKIIWSFGNNGKNYLFGKDVEQQKKSMHMAIVFNEFDDYAKSVFGVGKFAEGLSIIEKRLYLKNRIKTLGGKRLDLEQLERLQQLEQLEFYNTSYERVAIKENSVIYCDIPYGGTEDYDKNKYFDRKAFFEWANLQASPVFISEYNVEDKRFKLIFSAEKRSLLSHDKSVGNKSEKVYVNEAGWQRLRSSR